jgi:hypothetical protein
VAKATITKLKEGVRCVIRDAIKGIWEYQALKIKGQVAKADLARLAGATSKTTSRSK